MNIIIILIIIVILSAVGFWQGAAGAVGIGLIGGVITWIFGGSFSFGWYGGVIIGSGIYVWQCIDLIKNGGPGTITEYDEQCNVISSREDVGTDRIKGIIGLCVVCFLVICIIYNMVDSKSSSSTAKTRTEYATPQASRYRCTANVLNVRSSPSGNGTKLGTIKRNDIVYVYGINNGFAQIRFNGRNGYISIKYLTILK